MKPDKPGFAYLLWSIKEWISADLSGSPYHDNLYVAWTQFDSYGSTNPADSSRILFSRSTDAGQTWSLPVRVSDRAGDCLDSDSTDEGAVPAVGPNGEVYLSWGGPLGIVFDKSTDGGVTFGNDVVVTSQPGGWDFNVPGIYRCNGMPITACDISSSPYRGTVYIAWSDQRNGLDNTDVFLMRSSDGGASWAAPVRVNNDMTLSHQFFPWMTVDQSTGDVWFVFYDRRETTGDSTEVYCARSTDGGKTFANFRVSDSPFVPAESVFFGDYIDIAAFEGAAYPIWMRMDSSALSVWTAKVTQPTGILPLDQAPPPAGFVLFQNYPNPFNPTTTIVYSVGGVRDQGPGLSGVKITVYDRLGREVALLVNEKKPPGSYEVKFNASGLASGINFCRMTTGSFVQTRKMVLIR